MTKWQKEMLETYKKQINNAYIYEDKNFVEISGRRYGDSVCYRFYADGSWCEK